MDEDSSLDLLFAEDHIPDKLYELVRAGSYAHMESLWQSLPDTTDRLTTLYLCTEGRLSLLAVAALHGHDDIVRLLLLHANSKDQVELKGSVTIADNIRIRGATALYCACYSGHFTVAKTLIEWGQADVNQDTLDYPSCPLFIHASEMSRLDIVRFLVENKYADVNETKSPKCKRHTALMVAAHHGCIPLVEYLIQNGADIDYACKMRYPRCPTAVTLAAHAGHVEPIRLFYEARADMDVTWTYGKQVLGIASQNKHYPIIQFLLERSISTIDEFEVPAASVPIHSVSIEEMSAIFENLKVAMQYRQSRHIEKVSVEPIAAYGFQQECQTVDELCAIENDANRMMVEILLFRERIFLTRKDIAMMKPMHLYSESLMRRTRSNECLDVLIHMFYLYEHAAVDTSLHRFIWVFCKMLTANEIVSMDRFLKVCELVHEPWQLRQGENALGNAFYLLVLAIQIMQRQTVTKEERVSFCRWISRVCERQLVTKNGKTILHLCVDDILSQYSHYRVTDTRQYLQGPHRSPLRLLLTYGRPWLDVDAAESRMGHTPLHTVCRGTKDREIIQLLLSAGCHIDCQDNLGKTPLDYLTDSSEKALLQPQLTTPRLKCLCARIVNKARLDTVTLQSPLVRFVWLHGVRKSQ